MLPGFLRNNATGSEQVNLELYGDREGTQPTISQGYLAGRLGILIGLKKTTMPPCPTPHALKSSPFC